MLFFIVNIL